MREVGRYALDACLYRNAIKNLAALDKIVLRLEKEFSLSNRVFSFFIIKCSVKKSLQSLIKW